MSSVSPYQPPASELIDPTHGAPSRQGRYVVLNPQAEWPSRCFKCNGETDLTKKLQLTYVNPWIYLSILINILITLVLALIFRKRFKINLPLCEAHIKRRRKFLIFQWSMVALLVVTVAIGWLTEFSITTQVSIFLFLVIAISAIFGRVAFVAKLKKGNIWVRGARKGFIDSLPDHAA